MKKVFTIALLLSSVLVHSQIITTIAGNGIIGYTGDGGPATSAAFNRPVGMVCDNSGNIYVADLHASVVRKISISGIVTTVAGNGGFYYAGDGGPAIAAALQNPFGVALDKSGNLYISDMSNNCIRKVNTLGVISTFAGNVIGGFGGDGGPATAALFLNPKGIAFDTSGNLFIVDCSNHRVRKIDLSGIVSTVAGTITPGYTGDGVPATTSSLFDPNGIAVDTNGNIFIADNMNNRIRKVDAAGIITTVAGIGTFAYSGDGGAATAAEFHEPMGVSLDSIGNLYISDMGNGRIRKVSAAGIVSTIAGNGTVGFSGDGGLPTLASLNLPQYTAMDRHGNIYISDSYNGRVRKIGGPGLTTGINAGTQGEKRAIIYPNPAVNELLINAGAFDFYTVCNSIGQAIYKGKINSDHERLDISAYSTGVYFIQFTGSQTANVCKFVKP